MFYIYIKLKIMKKLSEIILFSLFALRANAQIEKGKVQVSGSFNISSIEVNGIETNRFDLTPQAGFFLSDNISLGVVLGYQSAGNSNAKDKLFSFGVFSRFYKPIADRFYFFAQPQIAFGTGETAAEADISAFSIGIRPGFSYFLSDKISMDMSVQGFNYENREEGANERTFTGFSLNPNTVNVGVSFLF